MSKERETTDFLIVVPIWALIFVSGFVVGYLVGEYSIMSQVTTANMFNYPLR
jgi:hypothetical protein